MTGFFTKTSLAAISVTAFAAAALAQTAAMSSATSWDLKSDMAYAYDKQGNTVAYKLGTSNAGELLRGAKKVPKGTLFFIGQNHQLYMRTGPYLEGDGRFKFGPDQ